MSTPNRERLDGPSREPEPPTPEHAGVGWHRSLLIPMLITLGAVGAMYVWSRSRHEPPRMTTAAPIVATEPATHIVTPVMADASGALIGRPAAGVHAPATDGWTYDLDSLRRRGPVVLTFIKDGCPCSEAVQPLFNELAHAYPKAAVLGVIDDPAEPARRWAERFHARYPLLLDPDLKIVRDYQVTNSVFVVLVDETGTIAGHWPGYSAPMLRELGAALARLTGSEERPLHLTDAPEDLYTGCPYDL